MNKQKFKTYIDAAEFIGGEYLQGYRRGLRRFYNGESFGDGSEHEKYMALDGRRQDLGDGYRDGVEGNPPRGMHGNTHAQGGVDNDTQIHILLNSKVKAGYVKQAQRENMKLIPWVLKTLSAACDK